MGDYLDASLTQPALAAFEKHLAQCPDCEAFLRTYKKTMQLTAAFLKMPSHLIAPPPFTLSSKLIS